MGNAWCDGCNRAVGTRTVTTAGTLAFGLLGVIGAGVILFVLVGVVLAITGQLGDDGTARAISTVLGWAAVIGAVASGWLLVRARQRQVCAICGLRITPSPPAPGHA